MICRYYTDRMQYILSLLGDKGLNLEKRVKHCFNHGVPMKLTRLLWRLFHLGPRIAYAVGLGPLVGRFVLLLTTTGRKSGLRRVTPLVYERRGQTIFGRLRPRRLGRLAAQHPGQPEGRCQDGRKAVQGDGGGLQRPGRDRRLSAAPVRAQSEDIRAHSPG